MRAAQPPGSPAGTSKALQRADAHSRDRGDRMPTHKAPDTALVRVGIRPWHRSWTSHKPRQRSRVHAGGGILCTQGPWIMQCTIMHNYAQLCTIMHNYAQLCTTMHDYARLCTTMHDYARLCTTMHTTQGIGFTSSSASPETERITETHACSSLGVTRPSVTKELDQRDVHSVSRF